MPREPRAPRTGAIFAVAGPSGAGKDTLMQAAAARRPGLHVVRRVITRPEEAGGEPFEGVGAAEFDERRAAGAFVLDWEAHGLRYGIPAAEVAPRAAGRDVMFNASRGALAQARAAFPGLVVIHVTAPAEVLAERLAARGRESRAQIAGRLSRARLDVDPAPRDRVVVNDGDLDAAVDAFLAALGPEASPA
jgi:phosphonate metabolism protein PhnN/1,5-bisphosphokinase (PRPP-forming)